MPLVGCTITKRLKRKPQGGLLGQKHGAAKSMAQCFCPLAQSYTPPIF